MSAVNESGKYTHFSAIDTTLLKINGVPVNPPEVTAATADVTLTEASHAGQVVTVGSATGDTVTLPAATGTGNVYTVIVAVTVTSNDHIIKVANATDIIHGFAIVSADDAASTAVMWAATANDDTITMDGSTTGGLIGDKWVITDVAAGLFQATGFMEATGSEATPFSATVA